MYKKVLFLSLLLAIVCSSTSLNLLAKTDVYNIPIQNNTEENSNEIPRTSALTPFSVYADTSTGELVLWANTSCGVVGISGQNLTTGASFSFQTTSMDNGDSFSYPVTWTSGTWVFTFTMECGDVYYGQINLYNPKLL